MLYYILTLLLLLSYALFLSNSPMADTLRAAILPCKSGFIPSDLGTVKLKQDFKGGSSNKDKKCPVFNGEHGIEALLYVEERFRKISSRTLQWMTGPESHTL
jgi:hypothetical protein